MVRRLLFLCCVLMLSLVALAQRSVENMNREWCYQIGDDIRAAVPGYDDRKWQRIGLPHSFSIPYFLSKDFYVGYGWYRKRFQRKLR